MRNFKRMLSLVLTVVMLATCLGTVAFAEETAKGKFTDVAATATYATAVEALSLMGVINGYPDGTFGPDKNVTRAEFTAMLMRILNYGSLGSPSAAELPFTDVSDSDSEINWAIPNINTAYGMNIINGYPEDNTFRPKNNVAYEEAVKMIVCTLGYLGIDVNVEPWYSNYIAQANRLGITSYASQLGQVETPATRACIAQMLYDSLTVSICENDKITTKTILSDYLGYAKNTGVISSNGITGLTQPDVDLDTDEIQIYALEEDTNQYETHTYKTTDNTLKNYLGYEVEFYYKDNGSLRTLAFAVLTAHNKSTLDPGDIDLNSSSDTQLRYYASEGSNSTSSVTLDAENVVIYNGKLWGATAAASRFDLSMIPQIGTINLLDSDNDKRYDVVEILDYEIYYVSSKLTSEFSITDDVTRTGTDKKLILDVENSAIETTITDAKGNEMQFSSIPVGSIICLAKSNSNGGEMIQRAVVVNDTVTGTITGTKAGTSMTINGTTYEYSDAAPWMPGNSGTLAEPALQDNGTYCKDINGNIVAYKKNATSENVAYGYIMGTAKSTSSFADEVTIRVLAQNGNQITASINASTRVDNASYNTVAEVISALETSARLQNTDAAATNVGINQLIKYTTRTNAGVTYLSKIYTGKPTTQGVTSITSDALPYYTRISAADSMEYNQSSGLLTGNGISINVRNATVFNIPSNRSDHDDYTKSTASSFRNGTMYNVEVFDVTSTNSATAVVCYGADSSSAVDEYTPISVITERVVQQLNSQEGKTMSYLEGYTSDGTLGAWVSDESTWTPQLGDIYRAGTDRDGYDLLLDENVLYSVNGGNSFGQTFYAGANSNYSFYTSPYAVILGSVVARDDQNITFIPQYLGEGDVVDDITAKSISFSISDFSGARVLHYLYENGDLTISSVSSEYDSVIRSLATYDEGLTNPTKVLIYLSEGDIELFCVLGEDIAE